MFCNTILHTHIVLHLFLISNFSDCISLINTRFRIRKDCFGKVEKDTEEENVWQSWRGLLGYLTFNARSVYCFGEYLFECKWTVTSFRIPIEHGIHPISQLGTVLGLCHSDSSAFDTQQWAPGMFQLHIIWWFWFWSQSRKKKHNTLGCIDIALLIYLSVFLNRKDWL